MRDWKEQLAQVKQLIEGGSMQDGDISDPTVTKHDNGSGGQPQKKLKVDIFDKRLSGETHVILAQFIRQAQQEGWTREELDPVIEEAKSDDYDHLIQTLMKHTE